MLLSKRFLPSVGSIIIDADHEFSLIAKGKLDARICFKPYGKDYDFVPDSLLVSEAGGKVTNIGKDSYSSDNVGLIAANPNLHKESSEIFSQF